MSDFVCKLVLVAALSLVLGQICTPVHSRDSPYGSRQIRRRPEAQWRPSYRITKRDGQAEPGKDPAAGEGKGTEAKQNPTSAVVPVAVAGETKELISSIISDGRPAPEGGQLEVDSQQAKVETNTETTSSPEVSGVSSPKSDSSNGTASNVAVGEQSLDEARKDIRVEGASRAGGSEAVHAPQLETEASEPELATGPLSTGGEPSEESGQPQQVSAPAPAAQPSAQEGRPGQKVEFIVDNTPIAGEGELLSVEEPNEGSNSVEPKAEKSNEIPEAKVSPNATVSLSKEEPNKVESRGDDDELNEVDELYELNTIVRRSYELDLAGCNQTIALISKQVLNATVERILDSLANTTCSEDTKVSLVPAKNTAIKGYLMEVASMQVLLGHLTNGLRTRVQCLGQEELVDGDKRRLKVRFGFTQELSDTRLTSRWRLYPKLQQDDIPLQVFGDDRTDRKRSGSRCQRFKLDGGLFYLDLLSPKSWLVFELVLTRSDDQTFDFSANTSLPIKASQFSIKDLYLDGSLKLEGPNSRAQGFKQLLAPGHYLEQSPAGLATVQILHDRNNHHRRNNWLLDLYANWLKHGYRAQFKRHLAEAVVYRVNSCLTN